MHELSDAVNTSTHTGHKSAKLSPSTVQISNYTLNFNPFSVADLKPNIPTFCNTQKKKATVNRVLSPG